MGQGLKMHSPRSDCPFASVPQQLQQSLPQAPAASVSASEGPPSDAINSSESLDGEGRHKTGDENEGEQDGPDKAVVSQSGLSAPGAPGQTAGLVAARGFSASSLRTSIVHRAMKGGKDLFSSISYSDGGNSGQNHATTSALQLSWRHEARSGKLSSCSSL